ncbi:hypothetical protein PIB30_101645 [Stylosanthes scabra]|uniref:Uncharacterized protein n=1 Tax=Stylosanthes scabra TaxID=79078 RepID=A0ABU6UWD7_9FABA|nr:hypothetical protein [Stylosanthes scabra]
MLMHQMAKREAKRPDKRSDSRCTPLKFRKIYDRLSDEKKALIDEMGLGAFQHLPNFYINYKILIELVRSYDIFTNTISTSVGDLFEKRQKEFEDKLNEEEKEALDLFKGKSLTFVQDMVKDCPIETDQQKRAFKRAFALFIQKSFLLPTSSAYISPVHLPVIRDVDNTQGKNWAHHVNSFLINGIKEFHEQGSQAVKGCHFVLMIIYFRERYDGKSLNDPNSGEENEHDDADDTESNNEEKEYNSADDSETETDSEEVQQERRAKRRQEESVIAARPVHDSTVDETGPESGPQPQPGPEPEHQPQPEPQPEPAPQPQPQPEAAIRFGDEPQEVIDGFVAACQEVEETEAAIKACEEAEL